MGGKQRRKEGRDEEKEKEKRKGGERKRREERREGEKEEGRKAARSQVGVGIRGWWCYESLVMFAPSSMGC